MTTAVAVNPFRRASFETVDRVAIPALVYRFLRSRVRPAIRRGRWDKAWDALANDQGPKLFHRDLDLFDENFGELLVALHSARRSPDPEARTETKMLVKRVIINTRVAATAARRGWRPAPRRRWVPAERSHQPKRSRDEWAAERAAAAERRAEQSARNAENQDRLAEERAAWPWGEPLPRRLQFWNSRRGG